MVININQEMREETLKLWKEYLLSEVAEDLLMGEVKDHLYVDGLNYKELYQKGERYLIESVVKTAFEDSIEYAASALMDEPDEFMPYSELAQLMSKDEIIDHLFVLIVSCVKRYSVNEIMKNPYYLTIKLGGKYTKEHIVLTDNDYLAGEFIQTYHDEFDKNNPFIYGTAGFFDQKIQFPVLLENGTVWMSVVLSETQSMEEPLSKAHGHVITYGLGLGYFSFMASEKEEVDSVTVVEMNPKMISLFKEKLLPQFPNKEKIHICEANALDYVELQEDGQYDYAFSDFWAGLSDGLFLYLDFLARTGRFKKTVHDYWIENSIVEYYFRPIIMQFFMSEILNRTVHLYDANRKVRVIQKAFYDYLREVKGTLNTKDDLYELLETSKLVHIVRSFAIGTRVK